jgi:hypothetical protein
LREARDFPVFSSLFLVLVRAAREAGVPPLDAHGRFVNQRSVALHDVLYATAFALIKACLDSMLFLVHVLVYPTVAADPLGVGVGSPDYLASRARDLRLARHVLMSDFIHIRVL